MRCSIRPIGHSLIVQQKHHQLLCLSTETYAQTADIRFEKAIFRRRISRIRKNVSRHSTISEILCRNILQRPRIAHYTPNLMTSVQTAPDIALYRFPHRHLLGIEGLSASEIKAILDLFNILDTTGLFFFVMICGRAVLSICTTPGDFFFNSLLQ